MIPTRVAIDPRRPPHVTHPDNKRLVKHAAAVKGSGMTGLGLPLRQAMVFTDTELEYLNTQRLGRIATVSAKGEPDVAAVGFGVDGDEVVVGGLDLTKTRKYYNVVATGRASLVVDDLASVEPWRPRLVKVTGKAEIGEDSRGKPTIRIRPDTVWSFGLGGDFSKRSVA